MNGTAILYAVLALGALGVLFGAALSFADKKFHVEEDERVARVRECLGGANCGACGFAGCDAFAKAVVEGKAQPNACTPAGPKAVAAICEIMGVDAAAQTPMVARVICQGECGVAKDRYQYDGYQSCLMAASLAGGPKVCRYACVGLGDCADVCAFDAITIKDGVSVIDPEKCTGCGNCVKACPRNAIELKPLDASVLVRCRNSDNGRDARAACMKACIACKRCEKTCKYDAIKVENGFARIDAAKCTRCGECAAACPCGCITVG